MRARRWWWRLGGAVVLYAALLVVLTWADFDPAPVRLGLLVAVCAALSGLLVDGVGESDLIWTVAASGSLTPAGRDQRLSMHVRVLESHLTARVPDGALSARLRSLADQRLERRYGVTSADPRGAELLGPEMSDVLAEDPRRLGRCELERFVRRIEEL